MVNISFKLVKGNLLKLFYERKILEEIKLLADKYRVLNNLLLALLSGLAGVVFAFSQNKLVLNFVLFFIIIIGLVSFIIISMRIFKIQKQREELIEKLKEKRWNKKS